MPSFFNYFKKIKYYLIRNIETIPLINILILNNLYYFRYFLPHDKDYLGIKNSKALDDAALLYKERYKIVCKSYEELSNKYYKGN